MHGNTSEVITKIIEKNYLIFKNNSVNVDLTSKKCRRSGKLRNPKKE